MTFSQPLISVDVVPLQFDATDGQVHVLLGRRIFEPFLNELALPGVLLQQELVHEAVNRALQEKVAVDSRTVTVRDAGVFDNPDRDPRGPTLSVAHVAAVARDASASDQSVSVPLLSVASLPFDHESILTSAARVLLSSLWFDEELTRRLLGATFSSREARQAQGCLEQFLEGSDSTNAANVSRKIAGSGWVERLPEHGKSSQAGGRPPVLWQWR